MRNAANRSLANLCTAVMIFSVLLALLLAANHSHTGQMATGDYAMRLLSLTTLFFIAFIKRIRLSRSR